MTIPKSDSATCTSNNVARPKLSESGLKMNVPVKAPTFCHGCGEAFQKKWGNTYKFQLKCLQLQQTQAYWTLTVESRAHMGRKRSCWEDESGDVRPVGIKIFNVLRALWSTCIICRAIEFKFEQGLIQPNKEVKRKMWWEVMEISLGKMHEIHSPPVDWKGNQTQAGKFQLCQASWTKQVQDSKRTYISNWIHITLQW